MDAKLLKDPPSSGIVEFEHDAASESGQIIQVPDGRAGVRLGLNDLESGDHVAVAVEGQARINNVEAATSFDAGDDIGWDESEAEAVAGSSADADYYLGKALADTSAGDPVDAQLNAPDMPTVGS